MTVDAGRVRIGTSGWTYASWQGPFYPDGLARRRRLEYLATRLDAAEVNGTFYSLQRASTFRAWAAATGEDFRFAVKGSRYITHMKRLHDVDQALGRFFASGPLALGEKLGPVLWQLPPATAWDAERIPAFLAGLPRSTGAAADTASARGRRGSRRPPRTPSLPTSPSHASPVTSGWSSTTTGTPTRPATPSHRGGPFIPPGEDGLRFGKPWFSREAGTSSCRRAEVTR